MLKTQAFLNNYRFPGEALEAINRLHGVHSKEHVDGRVIFDYDQIEAVKTNPIVRECRGLVLDKNNNWALVAKGFDRFFNYGEVSSGKDHFDWENCYAGVKHDGTMCLVYRFNGEVKVSTRFSFADNRQDCGFTFEELFWKGADYESICEWFKDHPRSTLIEELTSPLNKIVRQYDKTQSVLLSIMEWDNENIREYGVKHLEAEAKKYNWPVTTHEEVKSIFQVQEMIDKLPNDNEGFVVRDCSGSRFKIKKDSYIALHSLKGNGNYINPNYMVPMVLKGETGEIFAYFPEVGKIYEECEEFFRNKIQLVNDIYNGIKHIESQKEFALQVQKLSVGRIGSILFTMRNRKQDVATILADKEYKMAIDLYGETYDNK